MARLGVTQNGFTGIENINKDLLIVVIPKAVKAGSVDLSKIINSDAKYFTAIKLTSPSKPGVLFAPQEISKLKSLSTSLNLPLNRLFISAEVTDSTNSKSAIENNPGILMALIQNESTPREVTTTEEVMQEQPPIIQIAGAPINDNIRNDLNEISSLNILQAMPHYI